MKEVCESCQLDIGTMPFNHYIRMHTAICYERRQLYCVLMLPPRKWIWQCTDVTSFSNKYFLWLFINTQVRAVWFVIQLFANSLSKSIPGLSRILIHWSNSLSKLIPGLSRILIHWPSVIAYWLSWIIQFFTEKRYSLVLYWSYVSNLGLNLVQNAPLGVLTQRPKYVQTNASSN